MKTRWNHQFSLFTCQRRKPQSRGKVEKNHNPGSAFTQAAASKESKWKVGEKWVKSVSQCHPRPNANNFPRNCKTIESRWKVGESRWKVGEKSVKSSKHRKFNLLTFKTKVGEKQMKPTISNICHEQQEGKSRWKSRWKVNEASNFK